MPEQDLVAAGRDAVRNLLTLMPLVRGDHKQKNVDLFVRVDAEAPSIDNQAWGEVAFISGVYSSFMGRQSMSSEQRRALWNALVWALQYEHRMRPKMLRTLARKVISFVKECAGDPSFVQTFTASAPVILPLFDVRTLEFARAELQNLQIAQVDNAIAQAIEALPAETPQSRGPESSDASPAGGLKRLWQYLDRKREAQNSKDLELVRDDPEGPLAHPAISRLGGTVLRNMVQRYLRGTSDVPDSEIEVALAIALEIIRHSTGDFKLKAAASSAILRAIRDMRRNRFDKQTFLDEIPNSFREDRESWNALAGCMTFTLAQMKSGEQSREAALECAKTLGDHLGLLEDSRRNEFYAQGKAHAPDSLLIDSFKPAAKPEDKGPVDWLSALLRAFKRLDLKETTKILKENRPQLISDLCLKLASTNPGFDTILQPRRAIRMPGPKRDGKPSDAFLETKRLLDSSNEDDRRRACDTFEQYGEKKIHPDYQMLAREWMLYARAQVKGLQTVFAEWQRDLKTNAASSEEAWNLAVFNIKLEDFAAALEALRPGVQSLKAPYSHLRFALYCALQIVDLSSTLKPETVGIAQRFLIDNIRLHPLPECYLAWLLFSDEAGVVLTPQDRVAGLGTFQQLHERALAIPDPADDYTDGELENFHRQLNDLKLDRTWLLWINDFAERNSWRSSGFQKLMEALEAGKKDVEGAIERAEEVCRRMVELQKRSYEQKRQKVGEADPRYLRGSLIGLFTFYKRNLLEPERVRAYKSFSKEFPYKLCWDVRDPANSALVSLTRDLIEAANPVGGPGVGGGGDPRDAYFLEGLRGIKSVADLLSMQERIMAWIDRTIRGGNIVQQRAGVVKELVQDIGKLELEKRTKANLQLEIRRVNTQLNTAAEFVSTMKELRPLQAVLEAAQTAYSEFTKATTLQPSLRVAVVPPGIPADTPETSLVIDIENFGPGDVTNLRIRCVDGEEVESREDVRLPELREKQRVTIALPVTTSGESQAGDQVNCTVQAIHDCGVLRDLKATPRVTTTLFDFVSILSRTKPGAYEIPIPYTEEPIDFSRDDERLFQGREAELEQVRAVLSGQLKTDPIYYHGVRKVGKSSLLRRVAIELAKADVLPLTIRLDGIQAKQQELPVIVNTLTTKILYAMRASGVATNGLEPVTVSDSNPVMSTFNLFHCLPDLSGGRRVALLIDDFQNLAAPVAIPILDILRQLFQERRLLLFFSGYFRPKKLEKDTGDTQLFPLLCRGIDFLSRDAVAKVLREPLREVDIRVPDSAVETAFEFTAGNPHHLAALAIRVLNRLNAERRLCMTTQDFESGAEGIIIDDRYFRFTIFSQMILTPEEREGAIRFAQAQKRRKAIPVVDATQVLSPEMLDDLREKGILIHTDGQIGVKGTLLARYLEGRIIEAPPEKKNSKNVRKVGLFVDAENVRPFVPPGMSWEAVGHALIRYAEQWGTVEPKWASIDPANFANPGGVRYSLEKANINVSFPRAPRTKDHRKDAADAVLIRLMNEELRDIVPDVLVLVSGDHIYYETVNSLLEKGCEIRVLGDDNSVSSDYTYLEKEDAERRLVDGLDQKFFVDTGLRRIVGAVVATAGD